MLAFFRRYLLIFTAELILFSPMQDTQAADGVLYLLNYEDTAVSPRAKVIGLAEKLKRLARQSTPGNPNAGKREIFVTLADGRKSKPYTFRLDRRGNLRITLPDTYEKLLSEPDAMSRLTGWFLLGRAGKDPNLEKQLRNSWFVTGLSRKALLEMTSVRMPFSGYFPAAYTLTSAGRYPSLQALLSVQLTPDDSSLRLIYEEYCELLVMICARNGFFKAGLLEQILEDAEKFSPRDMPKRFRALTRPVLGKKYPEKFPEKRTDAELETAYEAWFRQELEELLNWNFLPAPAGKVETRFQEAVRFEGRLKKTDRGEESVKTVRGGLSELVQYYDRLETPQMAAAQIIAGLSRLIPPSPPDLKIPVSNVRNALASFTASPSPRNGELLLAAEQKFYQALETNLVLEKFLSDTERECVMPAARYYLTFRLIAYEKRPGSQPVPRLAQLLEQAEKEMEK